MKYFQLNDFLTTRMPFVDVLDVRKFLPLQHKMDQSKIRFFDMVDARPILEFVLERTFVDIYLDYGSLILNKFC